jgi:hypothetical protein
MESSSLDVLQFQQKQSSTAVVCIYIYIYIKLMYIYTYVQFHKRRTYTCIYMYIHVHLVVIVKMNCVLMQKSGHTQNQAEMSNTFVFFCKVICACCKKLCHKNDPLTATNLIYLYICTYYNFVDVQTDCVLTGCTDFSIVA